MCDSAHVRLCCISLIRSRPPLSTACCWFSCSAPQAGDDTLHCLHSGDVPNLSHCSFIIVFCIPCEAVFQRPVFSICNCNSLGEGQHLLPSSPGAQVLSPGHLNHRSMDVHPLLRGLRAVIIPSILALRGCICWAKPLRRLTLKQRNRQDFLLIPAPCLASSPKKMCLYLFRAASVLKRSHGSAVLRCSMLTQQQLDLSTPPINPYITSSQANPEPPFT